MILDFRTWILLREHFDTADYDALFDRELDALLPMLRYPQEARRLASMHWTNYIATCLRNAGFREQGDLEERIHDVVVKLLVSPGGLFRGYDQQRHGPLDLRFKRSVANAVKNVAEKENNRRRYLRAVPLRTEFVPGGVRAEELPARSERTHDPSLIDRFRDLLQSRLGDLAVAVFDARMDGRQTKELVGLPELDSPGRYAVKQTVQQIKTLAREFAEEDPIFLRRVERLMDDEAATIAPKKGID